jgi:hypothetical protein
LEAAGGVEIAFGWGCTKSLLPPSAAKFYIETALGSLILRSKINEPSAVSIDYLARSAEIRLLHNPKKYNLARSAKKILLARAVRGNPV